MIRLDRHAGARCIAVQEAGTSVGKQAMTQTAKAQEPSMEEILASIRRIIADDDTGKPKPAEAAAPKPAPPPVAAVPARPAPIPPPAPRVPPAPPQRPAPPPAATNNQEDIDAMLADLDAPPKVAVKPAPPKPAAPQPPDVLDLTEAMAAAPPPSSAFRTIDGASDVVFAERAPDKPIEPAPRFLEPSRAAPAPSPADQGLISSATLSAVDSAFNSLAHTVLGNNARTLEDLVKEMLRPMLKGWLDDNLPSMVERIVRAEIERVSRGRP
jgi:cell pole-organizing protein PopZ